jgi:hypothetical protein
MSIRVTSGNALLFDFCVSSGESSRNNHDPINGWTLRNRRRPELFTNEMIVSPHFIINTLLQRGVLRRATRKTVSYLGSGVDGCWVWSPGFSRSELAYCRVARNFSSRPEPRTLCRLKAGLQTFHRARARANRFNGFYAMSKTAEAVRTPPPHSYTPLKQGVNEEIPSEGRCLLDIRAGLHRCDSHS